MAKQLNLGIRLPAWNQKATDRELCEAYAETKSVWVVAARFAMCGQSVHERLVKLNLTKSDFYTEEQKLLIRAFYSSSFKRGELRAFCVANGLLTTSVSRWAAAEGLTNARRLATPAMIDAMRNRAVRWHEKHEHPKGMAGKKHSLNTLEVLSTRSSEAWRNRSSDDNAAIIMKGVKTRASNGTLFRHRSVCTWKAGWRIIAGRRIFFRSRWEANYARFLEMLKNGGLIKSWEHEPETFWFDGIKRGCVSYLPDFRITNNDNCIEYHEVKGWMDARSKTKIGRMRKYHPRIILIVRGKDWFQANRKLRFLIKGWEYS